MTKMIEVKLVMKEGSVEIKIGKGKKILEVEGKMSYQMGRELGVALRYNNGFTVVVSDAVAEQIKEFQEEQYPNKVYPFSMTLVGY